MIRIKNCLESFNATFCVEIWTRPKYSKLSTITHTWHVTAASTKHHETTKISSMATSILKPGSLCFYTPLVFSKVVWKKHLFLVGRLNLRFKKDAIFLLLKCFVVHSSSLKFSSVLDFLGVFFRLSSTPNSVNWWYFCYSVITGVYSSLILIFAVPLQTKSNFVDALWEPERLITKMCLFRRKVNKFKFK